MGRALPFYASVRIDIGRTSYEEKNGVKIGGVYKATVIKNKVAPPMKSSELYIDFIESDEGSYPRINVERCMLEWCKDNELLDGSAGRVNLHGKSYYVKEAAKMLREDKELFDEVAELAYSVGFDNEEEETEEDD